MSPMLTSKCSSESDIKTEIRTSKRHFKILHESRFTPSGVRRYEPRHEITHIANNKGADQPAHLRSLISAFVVRCLGSIIHLLAIAEIEDPG